MGNFLESNGTVIDQNNDPSLKPFNVSPPPAIPKPTVGSDGGISFAAPSGGSSGGKVPSISSALLPGINGFRDQAFENSMASAVNAAFHGSNMRREQAMNQQMPALLLEGMSRIGALDSGGAFGGGGKGGNNFMSQYNNVHSNYMRTLTGANQGLEPMTPEEVSKKAHQLTLDHFKATGMPVPPGIGGTSVNDIAGSISTSRGGAGASQPQSDWKGDAQRSMMGMFLSSIESLYGKKYTSSFGHEYTTGAMPSELQKNIAALKSVLASSNASVATPGSPLVPQIDAPKREGSIPPTMAMPVPIGQPNQSANDSLFNILKVGGNPLSAIGVKMVQDVINGKNPLPQFNKKETVSGSGGW